MSVVEETMEEEEEEFLSVLISFEAGGERMPSAATPRDDSTYMDFRCRWANAGCCCCCCRRCASGESSCASAGERKDMGETLSCRLHRLLAEEEGEEEEREEREGIKARLGLGRRWTPPAGKAASSSS